MVKEYPEIVDAQEMSKLHPETFEAPTQDELDTIAIGDHVKVCISNERFWNIVKTIEGDEIIAIVDNDLINTSTHNLQLGDEIKFNKKNIFQYINNEKR